MQSDTGDAGLDRFAAALSATFPGLGDVAPLRALGAGFGSIAVETSGGLIFRIARTRAAAMGHALEARLLPALRARLPVAVPEPRWHAGPSGYFPFGVLGYRKLAGTMLSPERLACADSAALASDLAAFLLALHRFPPAEAAALGVSGPTDRREDLPALRDAVMPPLRAALTAVEFAAVAHWWDTVLADARLDQFSPALRHGDLWYENILIDGERSAIAGVLDFECAAIGDPAQDFATLLHLGEPFVARVLSSYRVAGGAMDDDLPHRIRRRRELREFDGLRRAIEADDPAEFADAIRKLRRVALFSPRLARCLTDLHR